MACLDLQFSDEKVWRYLPSLRLMTNHVAPLLCTDVPFGSEQGAAAKHP